MAGLAALRRVFVGLRKGRQPLLVEEGGEPLP
jgi:hypothetical protein